MPSPGVPSGRPIEPEIVRIVTAQLGRAPRGLAGIAVHCPHGMPAVIECLPYLEDGTPFPTLFYLSCPTAVARVSAAEAGGGVARLRTLSQGGSGPALERLAERYRTKRRELAVSSAAHRAPTADATLAAIDAGAVLEAGIGGPATLEKATCLHAYVAAILADQAGRLGPSDQDPPARDRLRRDVLEPLGTLWCDEGRCRRPRERRAAIDLGTNSVRLLVADIPVADPGVLAPIPVVRRAVVTRLGEGLGENGALAEAAMARTRAAAERFVREARGLGASRITVVGTSAAREASNGPAFIRSLGEDLGVTAGVVTGQMEARLTYSGATLELPDDVLLMDLGGGSTEFVRLQADGHLLATSLKIGCVRATETWLSSDPPSPFQRASARREAAAAFAEVAERYRGATLFAGVGGVVTTLSALIQRLPAYDPDVVHLSVFTREQLEVELGRLAAMTPRRRAALPTMQPGRAGVIVAGAEILAAAMDSFGYGEIVVSERDILDGLILAAG